MLNIELMIYFIQDNNYKDCLNEKKVISNSSQRVSIIIIGNSRHQMYYNCLQHKF